MHNSLERDTNSKNGSNTTSPYTKLFLLFRRLRRLPFVGFPLLLLLLLVPSLESLRRPSVSSPPVESVRKSLSTRRTSPSLLVLLHRSLRAAETRPVCNQNTRPPSSSLRCRRRRRRRTTTNVVPRTRQHRTVSRCHFRSASRASVSRRPSLLLLLGRRRRRRRPPHHHRARSRRCLLLLVSKDFHFGASRLLFRVL